MKLILLSSGVFTCDIYSMVRSIVSQRRKQIINFVFCSGHFTGDAVHWKGHPTRAKAQWRLTALGALHRTKFPRVSPQEFLWADLWMNAQLCCKLLTCCVVIAGVYLRFPKDYELLVRGIWPIHFRASWLEYNVY